MNAILRKTLLLSFCCHLTVFGLFNFTFGYKLAKADFTRVSFLGAILSSPDFEKKPLVIEPGPLMLNRPLVNASLQKADIREGFARPVYIKPGFTPAYSSEKSVFSPELSLMPPTRKPSPSVVMLYPRLPQHFILYFKDRQSVHIELMFNLVSRGRAKAIIVNRKISSGNLEVDLLSKRYLGHYLFVQQLALPQQVWQTVKIDLSAQKDILE